MAPSIIANCVALAALALLAVVAEGIVVKREAAKPTNLFCQKRPESCRNIASSKPRVVAILSSGIEVMCDTKTDGGGWTIFQRRVTGNVSFYRGWEEYKYGFGDVATGEFYLGNENIHQITTKRRFELRIDFTFNNATYFANYPSFRLYGEPEGYRLKVSGFSGNAGDSLSHHNNVKFTTFDKDHDSYSTGNCGELYKGGWWYVSCHLSNFNGVWASTVYGLGLNWQTITGYLQSATMTEMKFREILIR